MVLSHQSTYIGSDQKETRKEIKESNIIVYLLSSKANKCIEPVVERNESHWPTVIPTLFNNYLLTTTQFRGGLYQKYEKEVSLPYFL